MPDLLGFVFLGYLLVGLPLLAMRSAPRLKRVGTPAAPGAPPPLTRMRATSSTLAALGFLFFLSWMTGREFDYPFFAVPDLGLRQIVAGIAALAASFLLRYVARALRTEPELRKHPAYALAPRTAGEWAITIALAAAAGVAEESAYRGVGMAILWWWMGNAWIAAGVLALAFALAHWVQGRKSMAPIAVIALVMHALVQFTHTLVIAMVVHATYDIVAIYLISRKARSYDREAGSPPAS